MLGISDYISIGIMVFCLAGSFFFSGTETAYSTFNRPRMKKLAQDGNRRAKSVLWVADHYEKMLTAVLIGNNIVNIGMSSLGTLLFAKLILDENLAAAVSTAILTIIVLIFGEITPKNIAKEHADGFAMAVNPILRAIMFVFTPFTALVTFIKKIFTRSKKAEASITDEELKTIVDEAEEEGGIDADESKLIRSAIEFNDVTVNEILTPRVEICAIEAGATVEEITKQLTDTSFSRMPVYQDDLDHIVGILHEKDFYATVNSNRGGRFKLNYKKPVYVSEHTKISDLLDTFRTEHCHMAIVVDEFGGTKGLVTMEDIIEELIGEVFDEHDEVIEEYIENKDGTFTVLSSANLDDFFEKFDIHVDSDETLPQTLNGWVMMMLECLPDVGATIVYQNLHIEVTKISEKRVEEVRVTVLTPSEEDEEEAEEKAAK